METLIDRTLVTLGLLCAVAILSCSPWRTSLSPDLPADQPDQAPAGSSLKARRKLKASYLVVYALVMLADWLQGSYIFSLYHDQYGLSLHLVSLLFVLGFATAALAAFVVGKWADLYGRKRMCLVFVVCYTLSCAVKFSPFLPGLFLGRLLGGFATAILFSSFEAWLVSSAHSINMSPPELGRLLGRLTLVSSVAAVASGFVADGVVGWTGSFASPFGVSGACLVAAGAVILSLWKENYGGDGGESAEHQVRVGEAVAVLRKDPCLIMLLFVNTAVETTMYLWVALWVPSLQDTLHPDDAPLPLGRVFSSFMAAMSLGSLVYNAVFYRLGPPSEPQPASNAQANATVGERAPLLPAADQVDAPAGAAASRAVAFHARLGCALLVLSGGANVLSAFTASTRTRFLCFLAFEGSLGLYYPVVANLRAALIPDSCRATLTALFRVPFNVLVTLALVCGLEAYREEFLVGSGVALLVAAGVAGAIARRAGRVGKR